MDNFMRIGILVARTRLVSQWADESWLPHAVLPASPDVSPGTIVEDDGKSSIYFAGQGDIVVHPGDTAHYRDNLVSGRPSVWVSIRPSGSGDMPYAITSVTVDPYEGEALAGTEGEIVEAVQMPGAVVDWLDEFVRLHHVERPFVKRKRDRTGEREAGGPASPRR